MNSPQRSAFRTLVRVAAVPLVFTADSCYAPLLPSTAALLSATWSYGFQVLRAFELFSRLRDAHGGFVRVSAVSLLSSCNAIIPLT